MILSIFGIIAGLFLLAVAGDKLVDGALVLGRKFNLSDVFLGIVIIGFGTSLPEMLAGVIAAKQESSALVLGNMIGSNIANIGLVLAVGLLFIRKVKSASHVLMDYILMLIGSVIFVTSLLTGAGISNVEGWILIAMLFILLTGSYIYMTKFSKHEIDIDYDNGVSLTKAYVFVFAGIFGLYLGAELLINGAIAIAKLLEVPERIIGLTIVAVGTSLPELAATVAAAKKSNLGLVLGNVCGSNLFNLLAGAGIAATIYPLAATNVNSDIIMLGVFSAVVALLFFVRNSYLHFVGGALLLGYIGYILSLVF